MNTQHYNFHVEQNHQVAPQNSPVIFSSINLAPRNVSIEKERPNPKLRYFILNKVICATCVRHMKHQYGTTSVSLPCPSTSAFFAGLSEPSILALVGAKKQTGVGSLATVLYVWQAFQHWVRKKFIPSISFIIFNRIFTYLCF